LQLVSMCDGELALQPSRMCSGGFAMEIKSWEAMSWSWSTT
jgi:hypothetical protein